MTIRRIFGTTKQGYAIRILGALGILSTLVGVLIIPSRLQTHAIAPATASTPGDWTTYMWDNARSGFNSTETILNASTAAQLKFQRKYHVYGAINTQPMIVSGVMYWGAWDGFEYALDLKGNLLWQTYLGVTAPTNKRCNPPRAGVASSAVIATVPINGINTSIVFVGGGDSNFYALDASDGHVIWSTPVGTPPNTMIWDAPAVYNGSVYIGLSSYGDCPLTPGKLIQMDVLTGTIQHTFTTVPDNCVGGGIWGSPTIDEANNAIYVSTGTIASCHPHETMSYALVELSATDLSLIGSWQIPKSERTGDGDFGSTPTLFTASVNGILHQMVGLVNKNGIYYALDRDNISAGPMWEKPLASIAPGEKSSISSSAWDGTTLYAGDVITTINGQACQGSIRALDPATGNFLWEYCAPGKVNGALTVVPGLVIGGAGTNLVVLDAATGHQLFEYHDGFGTSRFWGAPAVSNGLLYMGNRDGIMYTFGL